MDRRIPALLAWAAMASVCHAADVPSFESLSPSSFLKVAQDAPPPRISSSEQAVRINVQGKSGRFTVAPDWDLTPGVMCTTSDRDFHEFRYAERIPYCKRNVSKREKQRVSKWYGVPWEEHSKYQFDHLLSLCLGGSNDLRNIWPMIVDQARAKAKLEWRLCERLRKGQIKQKAAVAEELNWFSENAPQLLNHVQGLIKSLKISDKIEEPRLPDKS
jgi:hypothetical protein